MTAVQSLRFECAPPGDPQAQASWIDGLTDSILQAGALSVSVEDPAADEVDREQPLYGEPGMPQEMQAWPLCRVTVLLGPEEPAQAWWARWSASLCEPFASCQGCPMETRRVEDCDWVGQSQQEFEPILLDSLSPPIWVGPHWHRPPARLLGGPLVILQIDPGMAFGTGGHATTQLCLQALQALAQRAALGSVLDYGCGSGILAIAAAKLGAHLVHAIDIDPVAVGVAQTNVERNGVQARVRCASPHEQLSSVQFDLVVANILAQPLKLLAPLLWSRVRPGGGLILSGLLTRQQDELIEAYRVCDLERPTLRVLGERAGWLCLGAWPAQHTPPYPLGDPS